jgi:FAD-dependent oxidoreductase domain-containing protein 1
MTKARDICVIGGGAIGASLAYRLGEMGVGARVVVVEPDVEHRFTSATRSAAAFRVQFNLAENVALSLASAAFFERAHEHLAIDGKPAPVGFEAVPYLVLTAAEGMQRLRSAHERQLASGAAVRWLDLDALQAAAPWLHAEGIAAATLGLASEGWIDPRALLLALRRKAESLGVVFVPRRVTGLRTSAAGVGTVVLDDGTLLQPKDVVLAAGAWSAAVARLAGVELPIEPRKRTAFVFRPVSAGPRGFCNVVDPTFAARGVYVRPFEGDFLAVTSPAPQDDLPSADFEPDLALFESVVRPALARRVRGFGQIELVRAWAGHYEINTFDQNAIIGPHPQLSNLYFACGFSGHGVMHAPAVADALAERLVFGSSTRPEVDAFRFERIAQGLPLDDVQASEHRRTAAGV